MYLGASKIVQEVQKGPSLVFSSDRFKVGSLRLCADEGEILPVEFLETI